MLIVRDDRFEIDSKTHKTKKRKAKESFVEQVEL